MLERDAPWWRRLADRFSRKAAEPAPAEETAPEAPEGRERREAERFPCAHPGSCKAALSGGSGRWGGVIQDVSLGGVAVLARRRFEPGTLLRVDLTPAVAGVPPTLWACVVRLEARRGGDWLLGCVLARVLSGEELQAFRDSPGRECALTTDRPTVRA
jgi:hypothetical protein